MSAGQRLRGSAYRGDTSKNLTSGLTTLNITGLLVALCYLLPTPEAAAGGGGGGGGKVVIMTAVVVVVSALIEEGSF